MMHLIVDGLDIRLIACGRVFNNFTLVSTI